MFMHQSTMPLPPKGEAVPVQRSKEIYEHFGLQELWAKIAKGPPLRPFRSDGCYPWFDTCQGVNLYPACFLHDLKCWAGYPGEDVDRLIAV
jgi:hypothetical protein